MDYHCISLDLTDLNVTFLVRSSAPAVWIFFRKSGGRPQKLTPWWKDAGWENQRGTSPQLWYQALTLPIRIPQWGFPKMGVPRNQPFLDGIFRYRSWILGVPPIMETSLNCCWKEANTRSSLGKSPPRQLLGGSCDVVQENVMAFDRLA